jgi:hypothetical protein
MSKPTLPIISTLKNIRSVLPPLKKLIYEAFWLLVGVIEMVRILRSLL